MKRRMTVLALLTLLLSLGLLGNVLAHADLESSVPAADSTLATAPTEVRLTFTQSLKPETTAKVLNASGAQVDNKDGALDLDDLDHKTYVLTLPALTPGTYTVEWTSVSDEDSDSHEGTFSFTIQGQAQPTAAPASTAAPTSTTAPAPRPTAAPANLPRTGESGTNFGWYILLGAMVLLIAGLALRGGKHSTR